MGFLLPREDAVCGSWLSSHMPTVGSEWKGKLAGMGGAAAQRPHSGGRVWPVDKGQDLSFLLVDCVWCVLFSCGPKPPSLAVLLCVSPNKDRPQGPQRQTAANR